LAAGQVADELAIRSTDSCWSVAKVLDDEGIELVSSTAFLEPLLRRRGC